MTHKFFSGKLETTVDAGLLTLSIENTFYYTWRRQWTRDMYVV